MSATEIEFDIEPGRVYSLPPPDDMQAGRVQIVCSVNGMWSYAGGAPETIERGFPLRAGEPLSVEDLGAFRFSCDDVGVLTAFYWPATPFQLGERLERKRKEAEEREAARRKAEEDAFLAPFRRAGALNAFGKQSPEQVSTNTLGRADRDDGPTWVENEVFARSARMQEQTSAQEAEARRNPYAGDET